MRHQLISSLLAAITLVATVLLPGQPVLAAAAPPADSWLVLLYADADDEILEKDIFVDLNEAELVGSTAKITIVAQIDRYKGGSASGGNDFRGGGNWTGARRYLVQKDPAGDGGQVASKLIADLGEVDMGDPKTLIDFVQWAIRTYPATRHTLIMSDHGMGWPGGWSDDAPTEGSMMSLAEIDGALDQIVRKTGIGQLDLLGFDACLMGQLEAISAVAPYARYAVASAEVEPALGWAYASFLRRLADNPSWTGRELGKAIVETYVDQDWRVVDPRARTELVEEQLDAGKNYTAKEVANIMGQDITLAAYDLSAFRALNVTVNDLVRELVGAKQAEVSKARGYSQAYVTAFDEKLPAPYIDLGHFMSQIERQVDDRDVTTAAKRVKTALRSAVVAERHGETLEGASGMSIFFPNSALYKETFGKDAAPAYLAEAKRFATASLWDDYLTFHYTKKPIVSSPDLNVLSPRAGSQGAASVSTPVPAAGPTPVVVAPGAGDIRISQLTASDDTIRLGDSVTLDVAIEGSNIGYVYIYTLYYDKKADAYQTVDVDFVAADETRVVDGVVYPEWGDEGLLEFSIDWEPVLNFISDGRNTLELAPLAADTYGASDTDTFYTLWGSYISGGAAEAREAYMRFDATGAYRGMFGYTGDTARAPREITPRPGDKFTLEEEWLTYDTDPEGAWEYYDGTTLTFGKQQFAIELDDAAPGDYVIGIQVEDLDGNLFDEFVDVTVKK